MLVVLVLTKFHSHFVSGHALVGHIMETTVVADEFECQLKCIGNKTCRSFNVHPRVDNLKRICELNNKTRQMKPGDLKKKEGSNYYGSVKVSSSIFTVQIDVK